MQEVKKEVKQEVKQGVKKVKEVKATKEVEETKTYQGAERRDNTGHRYNLKWDLIFKLSVFFIVGGWITGGDQELGLVIAMWVGLVTPFAIPICLGEQTHRKNRKETEPMVASDGVASDGLTVPLH